MELSKEQLELLQRLGGAFFSHDDCALVLEVDAMELKQALKNPRSEAGKAYARGRMLVELELREELVKSAKRGSSPSMQQLIKLLEQMKVGNV